MSQLNDQLETIVALLILVETDDLPELAKLHEELLILSKADVGKLEIIASSAQSCADLIESIILGKAENKESDLPPKKRTR